MNNILTQRSRQIKSDEAMLWLVGAMIVCLAFACPLFSQDDGTILAKVGDNPITRGAAVRILKHASPHRFDPAQQVEERKEDVPDGLIESAVDRLIAQRVVFDYLEKNEGQISRSEIELELDQLKNDLDRVGQTLESFLAETGILQAELEFEIAWKLAWGRYLPRVLTDDYLEQHYQQHRRQFDGSEMRVAHLLIKIADPDSTQDAIALAKQIRDRLDPTMDRSALLSWEQAVAQFSTAPTRDSGGEIGWIRFHEPMPSSFSTAAFQLSEGEISPPIVSPFGVHLIKCLELKEGKTGWRDAMDDVKRDAALRLFDRLGHQHRSQLEIVFPVK